MVTDVKKNCALAGRIPNHKMLPKFEKDSVVCLHIILQFVTEMLCQKMCQEIYCEIPKRCEKSM